MLPIDSSHLRLIWSIVETHSYLFQELSDEAICFWILKNVQERIYLDHEEVGIVQRYVSSRTSLIRDLVREQRTG
ncbi:hypothetical protein PN498_05000 [Oscillatoria sp. CS-180]|uniref:hypothetical protein n=1 Tax=Oscillatoria sp. CS-180 TaxID=3021720 RepID=UPI00232D914C|nr:hypothetical protein [Oscillatoria sp. CS-180]MDB9525335.1 hypothetical protein [Oscillatoria sp. CS-180]